MSNVYTILSKLNGNVLVVITHTKTFTLANIYLRKQALKVLKDHFDTYSHQKCYTQPPTNMTSHQHAYITMAQIYLLLSQMPEYPHSNITC